MLYIPGLDAPYPAKDFPVEATNVAWSRSPTGLRNVVGVVVNKSNKNLDWVRIEFTLVNSNALPVGSSSDAVLGLPAKATWKFKAPVSQADALGAGAPMLSCEYGRIFRPQPIALVVPPAAVKPAAVPATHFAEQSQLAVSASPRVIVGRGWLGTGAKTDDSA